MHSGCDAEGICSNYQEFSSMQLSELRNRSSRLPTNVERVDVEEVLVKDLRATMSPAQIVEQKLRSVMHSGFSFFAQVARRQHT
jgi:methanogenic corrinoid protein MtbC1